MLGEVKVASIIYPPFTLYLLQEKGLLTLFSDLTCRWWAKFYLQMTYKWGLLSRIQMALSNGKHMATLVHLMFIGRYVKIPTCYVSPLVECITWRLHLRRQGKNDRHLCYEKTWQCVKACIESDWKKHYKVNVNLTNGQVWHHNNLYEFM